MSAPSYPTCRCCDKTFMTYAMQKAHKDLCVFCTDHYVKGKPCHGK